MSERCVRCNSVGEDRRTLWMACFYALDELKIPFEKKLLLEPDENADLQLVEEPPIIDLPNGPSIALGSGKVECDGVLYPKEFFTLRVCKRCRSEWMAAIKNWYNDIPQGEDHDADEPVPSENPSGIFIRENGAIKQITMEEWEQRQKRKIEE